MSHSPGGSSHKNNSNSEAKYVPCYMFLTIVFLAQVFDKLVNSVHDDCSYPKGLIIAFALKKIVNATEQDGTDDAANGGKSAGETDGELGSSENAIGEMEKMVVENVNKDEEAPGDHVDKDNKEKNDTNNGLGSEEKETEDEERSPEGPTEMGDEKEERITAAAYVDDMNVVLREDLKAVFKKYGTVKVSC